MYSVPPTASPSQPPAAARVAHRTPRRKRARHDEDEEWAESEDEMQLARALSLSSTDASGLPMSPPGVRDVRNRKKRRADRQQPVAASSAEDDGVCGGCCFIGEGDFVGEPRSCPDRGQPSGGWGFTVCCQNTVHFDCLVANLGPTGKQVDSARESVPMGLRCPFCRSNLSRSSMRQLTSEPFEDMILARAI